MDLKLLVLAIFVLVQAPAPTFGWKTCRCLYRRSITCGSPPSVEGGFWNFTGLSPGDIATLVCNEGFILTENSTILCQSNATWSDFEGFCQSPSLSGTYYVTCFPRVTSSGTTGTRFREVYITSAQPTNVTINSTFLSTNRQFVVDGSRQEPFSSSFILTDQNTINDKVLAIYSDHPINIHTLSFRESSQIAMDSFLNRPLTQVDNEYILITADMAPQFSIIAIVDNTMVNITLPSGSSFMKILDKHEVYTYFIDSTSTGVNNDLTGTVILSDNDVVVIAGNFFATIPISIPGSRDMCAEQMLGVKDWSTTCFVLPYWPRNFYEFKVIAAEANTNVNITRNGVTTSVMLDRAEDYQVFVTVQQPTVFQADKPINAALFSVNENVDDNDLGDGSMLQCLNTARYLNRYSFFVPDNFDPQHKVRIVIKDTSTSFLRLNNAVLSPFSTSSVTIPGGDTYAVLFILVNELNFYILETTNGQTFGCDMYGQIRYGQYSHWVGAL